MVTFTVIFVTATLEGRLVLLFFMRKLRHREVRHLGQGHPDYGRPSRIPSPAGFPSCTPARGSDSPQVCREVLGGHLSRQCGKMAFTPAELLSPGFPAQVNRLHSLP